MEDRQEKVSKYLYSSQNTHNVHLQSEVRMLEERLKNLEYLKQTYERNAREKTLEIESLTRENFDLKSQALEKNRTIEELSRNRSANEGNFINIIEELRTNKHLLEQEINAKMSQIFEVESNLQEQYEKNLKLIDENQSLRKDMKEREKIYNSHVAELEDKLKQLTASQKLTEDRVNKILKVATPKKRKPLGSGNKSKGTDGYQKEVALNRSLKKKIGDFSKNKAVDIEERLLNSEKKIRELESALATTTKADYNSPLSSLQSSAKLRSSSHSIRNKKPRYV